MAVKLKYDLEKVNPFFLLKQPEKEVRAEYSRLRSVAIKRLQRLEKAGFMKLGMASTRVTSFKKLSEMEDSRSVRAALVDVYRFITSESSTVTGQRRIMDRTIRNFKFYGISNITRENFSSYIEYLTTLKEERDVQSIGGSPVVIQYLAQVKTIDMVSDELVKDFDRWLNLRKPGNKGANKK